MKNINFLSSVVIVIFVCINLYACSNEELINDLPKNNYTIDHKIESLSSQLFNTNWLYQYTEFYNKDGGYSHTNTEYSNKYTYFFSNEIYDNNKYVLYVNGNHEYPCYWYVDENGINYSTVYYALSTNMSYGEMGGWSMCGGSIFDGCISTITDSKLILKDYYSDGVNYLQHIYISSSNVNVDSGDNHNSYEKPDVGFYDFTATKSSLKVQYKIYNRTEADVSSAKIYYGTSNNPTSYKTASVSGTLITANISGLKSGTTYYVKCVATGKGGTTTTSVTKCITNF